MTAYYLSTSLKFHHLSVMAGLVPAIHVFHVRRFSRRHARDERGHDKGVTFN